MMITIEALTLASDRLKAHDSWVILTHRKADGDAVGSATALLQAGVNLNKRVRWLSPNEKLPAAYGFLTGYDSHEHAETLALTDDSLYVFLDCSNPERTLETIGSSSQTLSIDHHEDNSNFAIVNCVDGRASSTCEVLYRVFKSGGWNVTKSIAESLYTGIFTDTGSFTFSNTSPQTHRVLAELIEHGVEPAHITDLLNQNKTPSGLRVWARAFEHIKTFGDGDMFALSWLSLRDFEETGADMTENEGLPSMLMTIRGVRFAAMLTEGLNGEVRLSFRSREGSPFGAGEIARSIGGGGHERAAGCTLKGTLSNLIADTEKLLLNHESNRPHQ